MTARKGYLCLYKMCDVVEWLTGTPAWETNRVWLVAKGIMKPDQCQDHVEIHVPI